MIYIHHQLMDGLWYGAALEEEKVFATSFSLGE